MDQTNTELVTQLLMAAAQLGLFPLVLYFIYRGDKREQECNNRYESINSYVREKLAGTIEDNTKAVSEFRKRLDK